MTTTTFTRPFDRQIKIARGLQKATLIAGGILALMAVLLVFAGPIVGNGFQFFMGLIVLAVIALGTGVTYAVMSIWEIQASMANADAWRMSASAAQIRQP